jgi:hypothetical protein
LTTKSLITFLSELLPFIFCICFLKKINTKCLKAFFVYTILLAFFSTAALCVLNYVHSKTSYLFLVRIYFAVEYAIFIFFFSLLLSNKIFKKIILLSIIPFWIYCIYNFFVSKPDTFNNYPALIEFSVFILVIIYYFYEKMRVVSSVPLLKSISFWLCVGLFIYFTGNLFFLLFVTSATDKELLKQMFLIYSLVTITKNIILSSAWFANESVSSDADIIQLPENMNLDDDFNFTKTNNP